VNSSRKSRTALFTLLAVLTATSAIAASLPDGWNKWRYSREIATTHPAALNYIPVGPDILSHSSTYLADLRILDETGAETPYVVRTTVGVSKSESWPATIRENSFVPDKYTQLVLDLGVYPRFHNAVRLDTPETDFILWVEVDASDDARTWRIVKLRAPISRFRKEGLEGNQTIHYSENNARYLRVQIRESANQFPITGASIFPSSQSQKDLIPEQSIPLLIPRSPDADSLVDTTRWTIDLLNRNVPVNSLDFTTSNLEFFRAVRISTSEDAKEWFPAGGGEIYRYQQDTRLENSDRVLVYGYRGGRYLRVEILNGNDKPLTLPALTVSMVPRLVLFRPVAGHSYRLAYGNEKAPPPQYDLERTLHVSAAEEAFPDTLANEQENNAYQDPRPFSERHPALLWTALALAALALGYTALRTMRTPPPAPSSN